MKLSDIRTGKRPAPDRILVIGVEGVGKSTFGASAPAPIFIAAEDGIRHLDVPSFPEPRRFDDVLAALATLGKESHSYRTVVLDTLDWIEPLVHASLCARRAWSDIEAPGYGKGYVAAAEEWRRLLMALEFVRAKGMEVILLAHAAIRTFSNPAGPDFSRYEAKLAKQGAALIKEWCDSVLFATFEEFTRKDGAKIKGTSSGRRVMHAQRCAAWDAKSRHSIPNTMPLSYSDYVAARDGVADPAPLYAEALALVALLGDDPRAAVARAHVESNRASAAVLARAVDRLKSIVPTQEEEIPS